MSEQANVLDILSSVPVNVMNLSVPQAYKGGEARVLVIGDLHLSDKYSGRHVDYFRDCVEFLEQITKEIKEKKITHLILTGDLIGRHNEKNLEHLESYLFVMKILQLWNDLTNGNVYSARGNHDYGKHLTDFEVFVSLGYIKVVDTLDVGSIRFHMLHYGGHDRVIEVDEEKYNVAIMHTELHVEGLTGWFFRSPEGVELSSLENLYGVELVLAGHIHTPSEKLVQTSIKDKTVSLFYPGNGTRPTKERNLWEHCFGVYLKTDEKNVDFEQITFSLRPVSEIFTSTFDDIVEAEEVEEEEDKPTFDVELLASIIDELNNYNVVGEGSFKEQITAFGGLDKEAVDLALDIIAQIETEMK